MRTFKVINETNLARVAAYMPHNFTAWQQTTFDGTGETVFISGNDSAGWTWDNYVQPRLASGHIFCEEIL